MSFAQKIFHVGPALAAACAVALWVAPAAAQHADGKDIYRKANCIGCHKWHGEGGGGYGGAALSLRKTELQREDLIEVIKCGRPETRMPFHLRTAWTDATPCYGDLTKEDMDGEIPPTPERYLRDYQIEAVADYVIENLQGRGAPTHDECVAFWGADARECKE